jgi:hypothetical protein
MRTLQSGGVWGDEETFTTIFSLRSPDSSERGLLGLRGLLI